MLVYLKPKSIFPPLHSDTIFGSILFALNQLYPEDFESMLDAFKSEDDSVPFLVSSTFPFIELDDEKLLLFPKPLEKPVKSDLDSAKMFKKVKYIQESIFKSWINGEVDEKKLLDNIENYKIIDEFLFEKGFELDFKLNTATVPRNTINRVTNASENIFYSSGLSFNNIGLFFMVKFYEHGFEDRIIAALKFLKDRGFGGNISVGKGHFDFEIDDFDIFKDNGDRFVTLSRYIPTSSEIQAFGNDIWFELDSKRGRSSTGSFRKQIKFFIEGSTFPVLGKDFYGCLVDSGENAVEYGFAYNIGMKFKKEEYK